ncbi:MAG: glycosyltransferase [Planctomycetota bacterium]
MKILLLTPGSHGEFPGPAGTVERIRTGLSRRGHLCELFGGSQDGEIHESLAGVIDRFKPDVVHAHDVFRCGLPLLGLRCPWVVSASGDDLHLDLRDSKRSPMVCKTLESAHRVMVPSAATAKMVEEAVPDTAGKIDVVPRSADALETEATDLRRSLGIPRSRLLILLPGGLRPIKGQHRALPLIQSLRKMQVDCELVIVGPIQDEEYAAKLERLVRDEPRIRILPPLSKERMGAAYLNADVVLNTSLDEGMSPVLLEAGELGRPVVASDVPGNRELVRHRETGLLFEDEDSLTRSIIALSRDRSAAGALGLRLREDLRRRFGLETELDHVLSSYAAA